MVFRHRNVIHTSMVTVKLKKLLKMMIFKKIHLYRYIYSLQKKEWSGGLFACALSIVLKNMLSNVLTLVK